MVVDFQPRSEGGHLLRRPAEQALVRGLSPAESGPAMDAIAVKHLARRAVGPEAPHVAVVKAIDPLHPRGLHRLPPPWLEPLIEIEPDRDIQIRRQMREAQIVSIIPSPRDHGPGGHRHASGREDRLRAICRAGVCHDADVGLLARCGPCGRVLGLVLRQSVDADSQGWNPSKRPAE